MMSQTKMSRTKKLEVPRPLKSSSMQTIQTRNSMLDLKINNVDDLIVLTQTVACEIGLGNYDRCFQSNVNLMYQHLKMHGAQLESAYKDLFDRFFVMFRNGSQDENLDKRSRLQLLELIELRAKMWQENDTMSHYYNNRFSHAQPLSLGVLGGIGDGLSCGVGDMMQAISLSPSAEPAAPLLLAPGEVIKTSGKFVKPTKIPGKNYSKDEVVIRNADSGKVMGIKGRRVHMIEELSDTIISFQRVSPGAKERLVQITGSNEENVNHAKHLIGDTIRRNASPVRLEGPNPKSLGDSTSSLNSSASEENGRPGRGAPIATPVFPRPLLHSNSANDATTNSGGYHYTVAIGNSHYIKMDGDDFDILFEAKLLLEDRFRNFTEGELLVGNNEFYRYGPKRSIDCGISMLSRPSNGDDDSFRANGLSSPTDDDVFVKNSSAERSVGKLSYTKEMLLHYASSPLSQQPPNCVVHPEISRKKSLQFNGDMEKGSISGNQPTNSQQASEDSQESPERE